MGRISDSFGEMMDNAGYERAGDLGGGWSEHESGGGYENSRDRMDRHLSKYGKDEAYTNEFNERNTNGWGGSRSAISGAVNNTRNSLGSNKHSSLTNNTLAQSGLINSPYADTWNNFIDGVKKESTLPTNTAQSVNAGKVGASAAQRDLFDLTNRKQAFNGIGDMVKNVADTVMPASSAIETLGKAAAGKTLSNLGNIVNRFDDVKSKTINSLPSIDDKMRYNYEMNKLEDELSDKYNSIGNKWARGVGSVTGGLLSFATGSPVGAVVNNGIGNYQVNSALREMAKQPGRETLQGLISARDERIAQVQKEIELNRNMAGNSENNKGILNTMYSRTKQQDDEERIEGIPTLTNLWKNIYIK